MTHNSRIDWLVAEMKATDVDGLVAFCPAWHAMADTNAVTVLTGFKNLGDAALILDADGEQTIVVTPKWDGERASQHVRNAQVVTTDDLGQAVLGVLGASRARHTQGPDRKFGVAGLDKLPARIAAPIREACADTMRPMNDVFVRAFRCKTPVEIARAREIAAIAEQVFDRLVECARPGMHEFELAAELYRHSKSLGADDNFLLMSSSQLHHAPRPPNRRVIQRGDIILGEISPGADGQFVQICRTAVLGPISAVQQTNYDVLQRSMERGLAAARPGRSVASLATAMNEAIAEAGFAEYCRPPYFRVRGHGLGNVSSLPGDIGIDNEMLLEEGMTFVMHPNQFLPGSGYMFCGEPVVITPGGAEPLSTRLSQLVSIPV